MNENDAATLIRGKPTGQSTGTDQPDGLTIPGVVLGRQIGRGGMAEVYEGEDRGFTPPRPVAVKLMDPSLSADPEFRARFEREASIVATFRHDNIVHIYSSGEVCGTKYLVMEYLPGGTLASKLRGGPLPQAEALHIAARLAGALAYSHACHIIHRDFKPGNVLFTAEGKPVLSDFGVAKSIASAEANLTRYPSTIGAPRYMAPEQERGEEVTDRADVFSFALTLFEMIKGEVPPVRVRVNPGSAALSSLLPGTPNPVLELITRGLAADPGQRPSAREWEQVLDSLDFEGPRWPISGRSRSSPRGRFLWVAVAATAVLLAITLITLHFRTVPKASPPTVPDASTLLRPGVVRLGLILTPTNLRLRIDGSLVAGPDVLLAPGHHEIASVAPGYYGVVQLLDVQPGRVVPIQVHLESVGRPSGAAFDRFLDLDDELAKSTSKEAHVGGGPVERIESQIESLGDRTLQSVLRAKLLRLTGQISDAELIEQQATELSRLGDARAASAVVLMAAARRGRFVQELVTSELTRASEAGDPLATFLLALPLRTELASAPGRPQANRTLYQQYCSQLRRAANLGWDGLPRLYRNDCARAPGPT
jgi:Protein kinase domain